MSGRPVYLERVSPHKLSARIRNPLTGKQLRITDESEAKIQVRVDQIRSIISDFRLGVIGPREAEREINLKVLGAPMVRDLWASYVCLLHGQHQINTEGLWRVRLEPYFGKLRVYELSPETMARWERAEIEKGIKPKTIANAFWSLRTAIAAAVPQRVDEIPWQKWRPRSKVQGEEYDDRECLTSIPQLGELLRAANVYDERVTAIHGYSDAGVRLLFLILTGCRQSEAAAMAWDCVHFDHLPLPEMRIWYKSSQGWQTKHPEWTRPLDAPKMNKRRTQNLHKAVAQVLWIHKERLERLGWYKPDGPVFPGTGGRWRSSAFIMKNEVLREIVELAGFPNPEKWVVHSTRHSFGTLEAQAAIAAGDVKGFLERGGWTKIETAMGYMRKAGKGRPIPYIGEVSQADLPGVLPGPQETKLLERHKARNEMVLAEIEQTVVVSPRTAEKSMTVAELAERYKDEKELPPVIQARAKARRGRAYNQAKRDGKTPEQCREEGELAARGFRNGFKGMQKKARENTKGQDDAGRPEEGSPGDSRGDPQEGEVGA